MRFLLGPVPGTLTLCNGLNTSCIACAGSRTPQRFIAYGALYGAPLGDDNLPVSRKDYTYAESTTGWSVVHMTCTVARHMPNRPTTYTAIRKVCLTPSSHHWSSP
jgi:hypothetical protein